MYSFLFMRIRYIIFLSYFGREGRYSEKLLRFSVSLNVFFANTVVHFKNCAKLIIPHFKINFIRTFANSPKSNICICIECEICCMNRHIFKNFVYRPSFRTVYHFSLRILYCSLDISIELKCV